MRWSQNSEGESITDRPIWKAPAELARVVRRAGVALGGKRGGPADEGAQWSAPKSEPTTPRRTPCYFGASRRTSQGALSSCSPLNAGCRARLELTGRAISPRLEAL